MNTLIGVFGYAMRGIVVGLAVTLGGPASSRASPPPSSIKHMGACLSVASFLSASGDAERIGRMGFPSHGNF